MISRKFLKSSALYAIAGALPMASMVILVPFYLLLPVSQFGALAIYTTFATLMQVLITYSFDLSLYVYYHDFKKDPSQLARYVGSAFLLMCMIGLVLLLIGLLTGDFFVQLGWKDKTLSFYPYGLLSIITAIFQAFLKVHSSLAQIREKATLFFWSNVGSFILIAGLTLSGLLVFPGTLIGPVGGRAMAAVVIGVWVLFRIWREFGFHFDFQLLRTTFAYNNVTFIYQVQQWVINSLDRWVIVFYKTTNDVGFYDLAFKCMLMVTFIVDGLNNTVNPRVLAITAEQEVKESTIAINRYYYGLVAVSMLLVSAVILFGPLLLDLEFIPEKFKAYRAAFAYVPFIGLIYFIRAVRYYFVFPFGALKYVKPLPVIYLIVSVAKVALMILLIQPYGVFAVIASAGVSAVLEVSLLYYALKGKFHFRFNPFKLIIAPVFLGCFIAAMEITGWIPEHIRHAVCLLFCIALLFLVYRRELKLIKIPGFNS